MASTATIPTTTAHHPRRVLLVRRAIAVLLIALGAMTAPVAIPAEARTVVGLHVGIPLYAGPPAYYPAYGYGPYSYVPGYGPGHAPYPYYPAPVYYAPPPVVVVPAPAASACRNGLWRQLDGTVVNGVACLRADGVWQLTNR